ncbi:MAG: hypothetical protein V1794_06390 [Candidatus Glassbacteria bacterium]
MHPGNRQIVLEKVKLADWNGTFPDWLIDSGRVSVLLGGPESARKGVLRVLAGLDKPLAGNIRLAGNPVESGAGWFRQSSGTAYLPPPGEEVFTGTTVGEELRFFAGDTVVHGARLEEIELALGTRFSALGDRPVWDLSETERRLLLVVSQAAAWPTTWLLYEPFRGLDGRYEAKLAVFIGKAAEQGAIVAAAAARVEDAMKIAHDLLVLNPNGEVIYRGKVNDIEIGKLELDGLDAALLRQFCSSGGRSERKD